MSGEDRSAHAGLNIGRTLELARKERRLSLNQVEQATKIRATYLRALERENFDVLPAVYMQGSLKTYANFLHLDGEAMARELRRRQTSQHEPQGPAHDELQRGDYFDRSLIFLGGAADAKSQKSTEEDGAGSSSIFASGNLVYLGSAAFLALLLVAVALTLILPEDSQPEVSQIHEPMISQAPSQVARSGGEENKRPQVQEDHEQGADDKNDNRQPVQQTQPDGDYSEPAPTVQNQVGGQLAQAPPPPDARGTREPTTTSRGPRGNGGFQVQIVVGAEDPVRITGNPVADR